MSVCMIVLFLVVMFVFLMVFMCFMVRMRFFFGYGAFYLPNPSGRSGHSCIVETTGTDNLVEVYLGIVAFNDFRTGLEGTDDAFDAFPFFGSDFRYLVQQHGGTELNLLDEQVGNVFLFQVLSGKFVATVEFALQAECIDYGHDVVKAAGSVLGVGTAQLGNGTDGLGNRFRFADTTGFDDDVVEALHFHQLKYLFDKVGTEGTADAAVL